MNLYKAKFTGILPFRFEYLGFSTTFKFNSKDTFDSLFSLSLQDSYPIMTNGKDVLRFDTRYFTVFTLETKCTSDEDRAAFIDRMLSKMPVKDQNDYFFEKLNQCLNFTKYSLLQEGKESFSLRNVGTADLLFYSFHFEDLCVHSRIQKQSEAYQLKGFSPNPSNEWSMYARACDLINHGLYFESFTVSFSLLDDLVQVFLKKKLLIGGYNDKNAEDFIRSITKSRLSRFFTELARLTGEKFVDSSLKGLNNKRNDLLHNGDSATRKDAEEVLSLLRNAIKYMIKNGAQLKIPLTDLLW